MGFGSARDGKGQGKGDKKDSKYIKKVDLYKFLSKWLLRSYASNDGQILFTDGKKASKHLTEETIRDMLDGESSEMIRRLGVGISLASGTIQSGLEAARLIGIPKDFAFLEEAEKHEKNFKKTGFVDVVEWLREDDNDLEDIVEYLNLSNDCERTDADTKSHFENFLRLMEDVDDEKMKNFARLADTCARLYSMSVSLMEVKALMGKIKAWAKKVPEREKQSPAIRKFVSDATEKNLIKAVVAAYGAHKDKNKKSRLGESSSDDDRNDKSDSDKEKRKKQKRGRSSSESSSPRKKKRTGKKPKKQGKREKSSESTGSESKKKSNDKKERRKNKDKDASDGSSSDSGTSPKQKRSRTSTTTKDATFLFKTPSPRRGSKNALDLKRWPIEELNAFLADAQTLISEKEFAGLEVKARLAFLERMPTPIRKAYDLDYKSHAVLEKNVERATAAVEDCVKDVLAAYSKSFHRPPPKAARMSFDFSDEEERGGEAPALIEFTAAQTQTLIKTMEDAMANIENKTECLKIERLVETLEKVPEYFKDQYRLTDILQELKTRARLPRKEQQKDLYGRILKMGEAIRVLHDAQQSGFVGVGGDGAGTKALKDVFNTWPLSQAQELLAAATTAREGVGNLDKGKYKVKDIQTLVDKMPLAILQTQASLQEEWKTAAGAGDFVSNETAASIINGIAGASDAVVNYYEQQNGPSSASGAAAATKESTAPHTATASAAASPLAASGPAAATKESAKSSAATASAAASAKKAT